ncbi:MAG: DUF4192 domain-containing protein [Candidatus Nanopelagicales bacterium]
MTTQPTLKMTGPDQLVASLPYLLGFQPSESLVVVWTKGGRILLTQRVDLPATGDGVDLADFARILVQPLKGHEPDEAVIVVVDGSCDVHCDGSDVHAVADGGQEGYRTERDEFGAADPMPRRELVDAVMRALAAMDVSVRDALEVSGDRFRSYLCVEECCPPAGRIVDPVVANAVAASFAVRGVSALASRADLVSVLEPDPAGVARIEPLIVNREQELDDALGAGGSAAVESWRDEQVDRLTSLIFEGGELADADTVTLLVGLCDVRVRDTLLWHLNGASEPYACLDRLLIGLRLAPNGYVAPIATCAALLAWLLGDGARAAIAIDRALNDDPAYSLAVLVGTSISAGLPPSAWQDVIGRLTIEACRARPPAAQAGSPAA